MDDLRERTYVSCLVIFFFNDTATTEIYTLSLHDALPISYLGGSRTEFGFGSADEAFGIAVDIAGNAYVDRKSTRLNSSHITISYAVFCLKKKKNRQQVTNLVAGREAHTVPIQQWRCVLPL